MYFRGNILGTIYPHIRTNYNIFPNIKYVLLIESPPILSPDPKRLCNVRLVTAVEKLLGKIVFPELEPEDGVDGPGHGRSAVAHLFLFFSKF